MVKLEIQIQLWIIALKSKNKFRKIQLSPCSADVHSHRIPGEGWEENLKYLNGFTEGFATEIWASLTPFTSVWHLLYKIRRWWKGETKAMLAFQFLVLPVQDTSSQMFWGLWGFFLQLISKVVVVFFFFFVTCFRYQCFLKSRCVSQGGSSMWGRGCEVHVLPLAMLQHCSCEMLNCTGSRGSHQGGILHPRSRTCSSTSNGIQWFCLFVFLI